MCRDNLLRFLANKLKVSVCSSLLLLSRCQLLRRFVVVEDVRVALALAGAAVALVRRLRGRRELLIKEGVAAARRAEEAQQQLVEAVRLIHILLRFLPPFKLNELAIDATMSRLLFLLLAIAFCLLASTTHFAGSGKETHSHSPVPVID